MAEVFYNSLTETHDARSAGATAETKDHISPRAIEVLGELGIDGTGLRPKQLMPDDVEQVDTIIYFPSDYMPDYVKNSQKSQLWDVVDPHYHKEQGMPLVRQVRDEIQEKVKELIKGMNDEHTD